MDALHRGRHGFGDVALSTNAMAAEISKHRKRETQARQRLE